MQGETLQNWVCWKLRDLETELQRLHKALYGRKRRLDYFLSEGVSDNISRRAQTSVEKTKNEIHKVQEKMSELRQKCRNLDTLDLH